MSYSGEAADQVVRLSLNGVEVAAKLSGSAAKQLAIMIYAILKDQKKTKGKIRLTNMLRSGKELKVFAVKDGDLQKFCEEANCDTFLYLGGNEQSTHEYVSKLLGKQTIDTNTYGQSKGRSGSYTTNFQTAGRELMTPDEVRMLDNRYALLFIRGERPVKDLKYNILKHPNVALTTDGQAAAYQHGTDPLSVAAVSINLERLKQAVPEDTDTGDYVILTEEEVYDFMRKKAQENNQNSNYQEETYEKHHQQHHSSHHPSYF